MFMEELVNAHWDHVHKTLLELLENYWLKLTELTSQQ
jgi:hypothetical protein